MEYNDFKNKLISVDPSKECLEFLARRVGSNEYRGIQVSQHNRYDANEVLVLLKELYNITGKNPMVIRTTDLSKRPCNTPDEFDYARYVNNVSKNVCKGTQDSIRKNLFVDLHRMGLITRLSPKKVELGPYDRGTKKYVQLTDFGLDFIDSGSDILKLHFLYTRAIDSLTKGLADEMLVITDIDGKISATEFQFFLSFIGKKLDGHTYLKEELIEFIKQFRSMSTYQIKYVAKLVAEYCTPSNFKGNKINKRDYSNWLNETQQIFMLMSQTVYYEKVDEYLTIRLGDGAAYKDKSKLKRSISEKQNYFSNHSVSKTKGFELHHVVPLCWAKNQNEFAALDVWQNMVYIDGYKHSIITQNNNENVKLSFENSDAKFTDFKGYSVNCEKDTNIIYNIKNQKIMEQYNDNLLCSNGLSETI